MNTDFERLMKQDDRLQKARRVDEIAGVTLIDIAEAIAREDWKRASQAAAYLLVHLAKRAALKPVTVLKFYNKAT